MLIKKEYHSLAEAFSQIIIKRYEDAQQESQNFTLLVPALTPEFGKQLQVRLLETLIPSYLVVRKGDQMSEEERIITDAAATTVRKSLVVYTIPLDLIATTHESIKGAGGVMKEFAVNGAWPWIDFGPDYLNFNS